MKAHKESTNKAQRKHKRVRIEESKRVRREVERENADGRAAEVTPSTAIGRLPTVTSLLLYPWARADNGQL